MSVVDSLACGNDSFRWGGQSPIRLGSALHYCSPLGSVVLQPRSNSGAWGGPVVVSVRISIGRRRVEMVVSGVFAVSALHQCTWEDAIPLYYNMYARELG